MDFKLSRLLSFTAFLVMLGFGVWFFGTHWEDVKAQIRSPVIFLVTPGVPSGTPPPVNVPPVAAIDQATPITGVEPLFVSFIGSATDANDDPLTYNWDFKDGGVSDQTSITHLFSAGNYVVEFWANDGQEDSIKKTQLVSVTTSSGAQLGSISDVKVEAVGDLENNTQDIVVSWVGLQGSEYYTVYNMSSGSEVAVGQVQQEGTSFDMIYTVNDLPYSDLGSHYVFAVRAFGGAVPGTSCNDGVKNGDETDLDCGGSCLANCVNGNTCLSNLDCISNYCPAGVCEDVALCINSIKDGDETDIDCGGSCPTKCNNGQTCSVGGDCTSGNCVTGVCQAASVPPPGLPFM